ncbi:ADP-ribosyl cyclase/cyclic ADP-ribose hydrolase-like [Ptychodera flava]|uniref:ADP-ribosyl cyclase/cyclic ADP-ribose hydrolase-like n=1 Tax=Ptychodera flava TaxID=63121 RepID=UPI00396A5FF3
MMDAPRLMCGVVLFLMVNVSNIPSSFAARDDCDPGANGTRTWSLEPNNRGTPKDLRNIFSKRCEEWNKLNDANTNSDLSIQKRCDTLWLSFYNSFAGKEPCITRMEYRNFCIDGLQTPHGQNQILLYSGVSRELRVRVCEKHGHITIEDTLAGYTLREIEQWCGEKNKGINYQKCKTRKECESLCKFNETNAWCAFWQAASEKFAEDAKGIVHILLNGSKAPSEKIVQKESYLRKYEIPKLKNTAVSKVHICMKYDNNKTQIDGCDENSVKELMNELTEKNIPHECTDYDICYDTSRHDNDYLTGTAIVIFVSLILWSRYQPRQRGEGQHRTH